jgi:CHAD domain-containing protein
MTAMGFELNENESLKNGLRRIANELIEDSRKSLAEPGDDIDAHVHNARKNMKKLRAVLRLVRPAVGNKVYRRDTITFRDLGRELAGSRESFVAQQSLLKILENHAETLNIDAYSGLRTVLEERYEAQRAAWVAEPNTVEQSVRTLKRTRKRVKGWELNVEASQIVRDGLMRSYEGGYTGLKIAEKHPSAENLHKWRKDVKRLWYHLRILRPIWPASLDMLIAELDVLGDTIGLDHDYDDLRKTVIELSDHIPNEEDQALLIATLEAERLALQEKAWQIAHRVYAEDPKAFATRHLHVWKVWRSERTR